MRSIPDDQRPADATADGTRAAACDSQARAARAPYRRLCHFQLSAALAGRTLVGLVVAQAVAESFARRAGYQLKIEASNGWSPGPTLQERYRHDVAPWYLTAELLFAI